MKILALDLSTKNSGWAIFENKNLIDSGCIGASSTNVLNRIEKIIKELRVIFDKHKPDNIIVEEVLPEDVKNNQATFKALMYLQAAVALEFNKDNKKLEFFVSSEWRKICGIHTGRGITRDTLKAADIKFVKDNYNLTVNDDIADAICIGYAYTHQVKNIPHIEGGFEFR
jgi:Holliday junction resolvasome RuvABC endonuclease subunit